METLKLAQELHDYVRSIRRDIHQNPELSMKEFRTTDLVCRELDRLGISYRRTDPTGVIGEIVGTAGESDVVIMLRGDMDALEIHECTNLEYSSKNAGVMHACGHDTHTAMLLGAAKILKEHRDLFAGTVRLIFQPGEETLQGAKTMIAQGAMDHVTAGFGIHMDAQTKVGRVSLRPGPAFAAPAQYVIDVTGMGAPAALPFKGHDAALAACAININLQSIIARFTLPYEPLVICTGKIVAGTRQNILAEHAVLEGTYRCFNKELQSEVKDWITEVSEKTAAIYGCTATVSFPMYGDPMINDPTATEIVYRATKAVYGSDALYHVREPNMGSEDFAYYGNYAPCAFLFLGCGSEYPGHNEKFAPDEQSLDYGVAMHVEMALNAFQYYNS